MLSFPNAKINLGLSVIEKRSDGFHNIETVMLPIGLCDILEVIISPDAQFSFTTSGLKIKSDGNQNLVVKAWRLLMERFDLPPVKIHLHKVIPMGAGLGGGSSDAAFLIKSINTLFDLKLTVVQMEAFALELGSDCPFFVQDKPVLAKGRGELFEDIEMALGSYSIVVVKPEIHVDTATAYAQIIPAHKSIALKGILKMPVIKWRGLLINDFEKPVFEQYPKIGNIKEKLYEMGADYASMSGSGSAVFGLFSDFPDIRSKFPDCFVWKGKFVSV
jgi:4-diphosphocytidyl-2-C-methyl-D-erythritol kinase